MLKIDRTNKALSLLGTPSLAAVSITERYDLQEFISNSPKAFFEELGLELFLLGKEIEPSTEVQDRIDLLAVDKEGSCVVVELKRGNHKLHMLQAISYAGMISKWDSDDFMQLLDEDQQVSLSDFLEVDRDDINRRQRIILIAEAFDYALLIGAEWLSEQYGVDITCCRIALARDSATNSEYFVCSNVYPPTELAKEALSRGRKHGHPSKVRWPDWETALASVTNPEMSEYFEKEIAAGRESYLKKRALRYRVEGKRRWHMSARSKNAYVWQEGRFEEDIEFWKSGLSNAEVVKTVKDGECLSLSLHTTADFQFFHDAVTERLLSIEWQSGAFIDGMVEAGDE